MTTKTNTYSPVSNEHQHLLSIGALFEGSFIIDWIVDLTGKKASEVLFALEEGVNKKLLNREGLGTYSFSDLGVRMKWRNLLSPEEKEQMHGQIAVLLMKELSDDNTKAQLMATHLLQIANNDLDNCRVLTKSGDVHLGLFQTDSAFQCYTKVLNDLSLLDGEEVDLLFIEVAVKYAKISTARHDTGKVISILDDAMIRTQRWGDKTNQALIEMHLAKNKWLCSEYQNALEHFKRASSIAKQLGNEKLLQSVSNFNTFFLYWLGHVKEAIQNYENRVLEVEKLPTGRFPLLVVTTAALCYAHIGQISQALGLLGSIHSRCRERGDEYLAAYASCATGLVLLDVRRTKDAIRYLERAMDEGARSHNDWVAISGRLALSLACFLTGDSKSSTIFLLEFLKGVEEVNVTVDAFSYLMDLCAAMERGELPHVQGLSLENEVRVAVTSNNVFKKGVAFRYQAFLLKKKGAPHEDIVQSLSQSLKWLEKSGRVVDLAMSHIELVREYLSQGDEDRSKESAIKVSKILSTLGQFGEGLIPDDLKFLISRPARGEALLEELLGPAQEIVTIREDKELAQYIISKVNRVTGAERGAIFLLDNKPSSSRLILRASKNLTAEQIASPSFGASMKMIEEVAATRKGHILDSDSGPGTPLSLRDATRSRMCVPMIFRDRVIGVMYHDNRFLSSAFKESDLDLLWYFAALAGCAFDNVRAYKEIEELNRRLEAEKLYYQEPLLENTTSEDIVYQSSAMKRVLAQANQVASTDSTVLILGETGVGKELLAKVVHNHSPRANKPFVQVNCNVLTESLIQSELFGHEKGAFTGALQRRVGRFELANGGTLLLDEIGDLPAAIQIRLLNVLQSKEFERLGGSETIHSDFRLVAATNRNLEKEVKENRFRLDLYYRLNVFPLYVPPLRERKEDIPLLAHHFLKIYARKTGKIFHRIPESEMEKLVRYDWPGNVRELEHLIERGVILNNGPIFLLPEFGSSAVAFTETDVGISLEDNERRHILSALHKTGWKVRGPGGAAELLNVHPSTLLSRMKKLQIQRPKGIARRRGVPVQADPS